MYGLVVVFVQIYLAAASEYAPGINIQGAYLACSGNESIPSTLVVTDKILPNIIMGVTINCCKSNTTIQELQANITMDVWYTNGNDHGCFLHGEDDGSFSMSVDVFVNDWLADTMNFTCPAITETIPPPSTELSDYATRYIVNKSDVEQYASIKCEQDNGILTLKSQSEKLVAVVKCLGSPVNKIIDSQTVDIPLYINNTASLEECHIEENALPSIDFVLFTHSPFQYIGNIVLEHDAAPKVHCNASHVSIEFPRPCYELVSSGFHVPASCQYSATESPSATTLELDTSSCEVNTTSNSTHLFYRTELIYERTDNFGETNNHNSYNFHISCSLARRLWTGPLDTPLSHSVVHATGTGELHIGLKFWTDNSFSVPLNEPFNIQVGDNLAFTVELDGDPSFFRIGNLTCWVSPFPQTPDSSSIFTDLLLDGKIEEPTLTVKEISPVNIGLQYKVFRFVHHDTVRIHCRCVICEAGSSEEGCNQSYNRKRRSTLPVVYTSSPPILMQLSTESTTESMDRRR